MEQRTSKKLGKVCLEAIDENLLKERASEEEKKSHQGHKEVDEIFKSRGFLATSSSSDLRFVVVLLSITTTVLKACRFLLAFGCSYERKLFGKSSQFEGCLVGRNEESFLHAYKLIMSLEGDLNNAAVCGTLKSVHVLALLSKGLRSSGARGSPQLNGALIR